MKLRLFKLAIDERRNPTSLAMAIAETVMSKYSDLFSRASEEKDLGFTKNLFKYATSQVIEDLFDIRLTIPGPEVKIGIDKESRWYRFIYAQLTSALSGFKNQIPSTAFHDFSLKLREAIIGAMNKM
jgi:hypothetical protein